MGAGKIPTGARRHCTDSLIAWIFVIRTRSILADGCSLV